MRRLEASGKIHVDVDGNGKPSARHGEELLGCRSLKCFSEYHALMTNHLMKELNFLSPPPLLFFLPSHFHLNTRVEFNFSTAYQHKVM